MRRKKWIALLLGVAILNGAIGCGKEKEAAREEKLPTISRETEEEAVSAVDTERVEETVPASKATEEEAAGKKSQKAYVDTPANQNVPQSQDNQMAVIAAAKEMWVENPESAMDVYQYAVTDLDHNGRYEIILSHFGGTGRYTYSSFFEVNETFDGLTECETDFEQGDSQPDLISDEVETYVDNNGVYHYLVDDLVRVSSSEYFECYSELLLTEGKITVMPIAYKSTLYDFDTDNFVYECSDASGNSISEEEYKNAGKNYFSGLQKTVTTLKWQEVEELWEADEKMLALLKSSADGFKTEVLGE